MSRSIWGFDRRRFLLGASTATAAFFTPVTFAEQLELTPPLTEGPFYPDQLPLDQDNDLIKINDALTPAVGSITHLTGRVLDTSGEPIKGALIEIWQCDANGVYLHSADSSGRKNEQDSNFQGFGRFETNAKGEYRFRTIKPVPYRGRPAPHIHFKVKQRDRSLLTSQLFIAGHPNNQRDGIYRRLRDPELRERVETKFKPIKDSKLGEFSAKFDIVIGRTPDESGTPG